MHTSNSLPLAMILGLKMALVSSAPAPGDIPTITKQIDCVAFNTHQACDNFCFATFCMGFPDILHHESTKKGQDHNRADSGCNLHPFQTKSLEKYGTTRMTSDSTIADEYPLASSLEGGVGPISQSRAVIRGATPHDQQGQANWANKLWNDPPIPQGARIQIMLTNWDPQRSPYCEAKKNGDRSICRNSNSHFYQRVGPGGPGKKAQFQRVGV